ncbi:hypothetical protein NRK67_03845 [Fusobacteria bacterium ZRK30]|nr:hypothetical protein NRK67_03845 [Fusobacteria bacterium ZRK30]
MGRELDLILSLRHEFTKNQEEFRGNKKEKINNFYNLLDELEKTIKILLKNNFIGEHKKRDVLKKEGSMKKEKEIKCLKCKKIFKTEVDSLGVPYKKICPNCKKSKIDYERGILSKV